MKTSRIDFRTSESDNLNLKKAAKNLQAQTGKKVNASKTILTSVEGKSTTVDG
jgi:hypothetical protein